jgi:hypothetical protein
MWGNGHTPDLPHLPGRVTELQIVEMSDLADSYKAKLDQFDETLALWQKRARRLKVLMWVLAGCILVNLISAFVNFHHLHR